MSKKSNAAKKEVVTVEETVDNARQDLEAMRATMLKEVEGLANKSAKIRALSAKGIAVGEIAKILSIRYQHARNVLTTPLKRGARE